MLTSHKLFFFFLFILIPFCQLTGQIPSGYYDNAEGLDSIELKTALYNIIKDHTVRSYDNLWTDFEDTDKKDNGNVWDMYSDNPSGAEPYDYTFGTDQCGNYAAEGDCYNREHSFPKSWFSDASPMYSDLFHLYPTDGYVNGQRSAYPFGEVSAATWTSQNGSKVGPCSYTGYTGTVFEPIDEYKGDFARTYFYMATRYETLIDSWENNSTEGDAVLDGTEYPCYEEWFITMLLEWHESDTVSQKEIDRNDAVYAIQGNRNPFIDHPEYAGYIWGGESPANEGGEGEAHWTESFENPDTWSGYTTGSVTFSESGTWDFFEVYPETSGDSYDGDKACRINDDESGASITTPSVNTIGTVSFYYHRPFTGTGTFELQKSVNDGDFTTLTTQQYDDVTSPTLFSFEINDESSDIRLRVLNDDNTAHLAVDYFTVTSYSSGGVSNPSDIITQIISGSQIDLSWTRNSNLNNVMLAFNTTNEFGTPEDGTVYSVDDPITEGGTVLYSGSDTTFSHASLTHSTTYYYKLWSFDTETNYSTGVETNAQTLKNEPSSHVTDFAFTDTGYNSLSVSWIGSTGDVLPDYYLILAKTNEGSYHAVTDGSAVDDDTDWNDYNAAINLAHQAGTNTHTFSGLEAETEYSFTIYPYTNTGSNINYKTDETPPEIMVVTLSAPDFTTENFDNFPETGSSYQDGTFTGVDGSTWTYYQCRGDQQINGATPCLGKGRTPVAEVYSGTLSGGCGTLNFDYMQAFSSNVSLDVYINQELITTVTSNAQTGTVINSGDININYTGDFVIKLRQNNTGSGQVSIDNVTWTPYAASECTPPTEQATALTISNIETNAATLSWTRGNGDAVIVLLHEGSATNSDPVSGTAYNDSSKFAKGDEIGAGNYVVYSGNGTSVDISGLTSGTDYYFAVYEYFTEDACYYTEEATANFTTAGWTIPSGYYADAEGKTCGDLKQALYTIIKDHTQFPYTSDNTDVWDILMDTDEDPDNPDNILLLYTGRSQDKDFYNRGESFDYSEWGEYDDCWEREHVWAKSHGDFGTTMGAGTDVHNLRPADRSINGEKYSKDFDLGGAEINENGLGSGNFTDDDSFEPHDDVKGDVARMVFYMATRYEGENGEPDLEINDLVENYPNPYFGKLSVLLNWHENDPVNDWERQRNDKIYNTYQGNRNPYIDHPEYVSLIWNDTCPANPVILNIATDPEFPDVYSSVNVSADITDEGTITAAKLFWCTDGVTFGQEINMSVNTGNNYITDTGIPAQEMETVVSFFILAIDDDTDSSYSDTLSYTISNLVNIINEDFSACPSPDWTIVNVDGDNHAWSCSSSAMLANAYDAVPAGTNSDDWLISPVVNLNYFDNETLSFETTVQYNGPEISVKYSTDYSGSGDPNSANWTELSANLATTTETTSSGDIDLSAIEASTFYLAFHYTSTGTTAGTAASWTVDNIKLIGDSLDLCYPPEVQASDFNSADITSTTATLSWTRGDGDSVLVIAKKSAAVDASPVDETPYNANNIFASGDEIGTANFVVYNGTGTSVNISTLEPGTEYHFAIFEYSAPKICYLLNPLTGSLNTAEDPIILTNPADLIVCAGESATFTVTAEGTETISYQWKKDGENIAGATESTLELLNVSQEDEGNYSCAVSNVFGSLTSENALLTVNFTAKPAGTDQAVCSGESIPLLSAIGENLVWYSDGELSSQIEEGTNLETGQTAVGVYDYYVTQTQNNCVSLADTVTLEIYALPEVNAGEDQSITYGSSTILSGSASGGFGSYTYFWSPADSLVDESLANTATVNLEASTSFNLMVTDEHGCASSDQILVTVTGGSLSVTINADDVDICFGDSVLLNSIASGGTGSYSFTWTSVPEGFHSENAANYVKPIVNTSYKVVVDDGNQLDSTIVNITVNSIPAEPVVNDEEACYGQEIPDLMAAGTNVMWYSDIALTNLLNSGSAFSTGQTESGTYTYYATQTLNECESEAAEVMLTITEPATADAGQDLTFCEGDVAVINDAVATNFSSLYWTHSGAGTISNETTLAPTYNPAAADITAGSVVLTLNAEGNGSCESVTDNVTLNFIPAPIINAGEDIEICSNQELVAISGATAEEYSSILWTTSGDGEFNNSSILNPMYTPGSNDINQGNATLTLTGSNECGNDSDEMAITIIPEVESPEANDMAICFGDESPELYAEGSNIQWYADGDLTQPLETGSSFVPDETSPGIHYYYVTQSVSGCESLADTVMLTINDIPESPESESVTVCFGNTVPSLIANGENVEWYNDAELSDQAFSGNEFNTGETEVGSYTYYVVQNVNNCISEATMVTLTILQNPEPPEVNNLAFCEGDEMQAFSAQGENISWYEDEALTAIVETGNEFLPDVSQPGTYHYYLTQTINECESEAAMAELVIYPRPLPPIAQDTSACLNDETIALQATGENISWYADAELTEYLGSENAYIFSDFDTGIYQFYLVVFDEQCYSLPDTLTLQVIENPDPPVAEDENACFGEENIYLVAEGIGIQWFADSELEDLLIENDSLLVDETEVNQYTYFTTQTVNDCQSEALEVNVNINPLPVAEFSYTIEGMQVQFDNLSAFYDSLLWDFTEGQFSNDENPVYQFPGANTYTVCLTVWNECGDNDFCDEITIVGISEISDRSNIIVYPNPVAELLNIKNLVEADRILIHDIYGKKIYEITNPQSTHKINTKAFSEGIYIITFLQKDKSIYMQRFIK